MNDTQMSVHIVEQFYRTLKNDDMETFLALMHDDIEMNLSGNTPLSGHIKGKEMLLEKVYPNLMEKLDFENFSFCTRWRIMCAGGDRVTAIMEAKGKTLAGKPYDQRYCHIFQIDKKKVSHLWEFFDTELVRSSLFDGEQRASPFTQFEF